MLSFSPCQVVVIGDENHVVSVDSTKRGKAVADHRKQGNQDVVYHIDDIELSPANIDPSYRWERNLSSVSIFRSDDKSSIPIRNNTQASPKSVINVAYKVTRNPRAIDIC